MSTLGNILWFLLIGLWTGLSWFLLGAFYCITIIGIPIGLQSFKLGELSLFPFGKKVTCSDNSGSIFLNVLWILLGGWVLSLEYLFYGLLCCITIIGIPFGNQCFKLMKLSFLPFGAKIV